MQDLTLLSFDIPRQIWLDRWGKRAKNSQELAIKSLKWFDKYMESIHTNEKDLIEQLKKIANQPEFYQFLNNFVQYLITNDLAPRTTRSYFYFVKAYLRSKGFRIYKEDVNQFIQLPKIIKEGKAPVTIEQWALLYASASPKMRAIISTGLSSGMRIGEMLQLKISDIKGNSILVRAENTKTQTERITYFSKQAKEDIDKLIKNKEPDAFLFVKEYKPVDSVEEIEQQFADLRKSCGLNAKYRLSSYHHITLHRMRAFCKTMASETCGQDYAEGLIGHAGYLSTYYTLPESERENKYKLLEPKVTMPIKTKKG